IETIFHPVNIFDEISFETSATISLSSDCSDLPNDNRNLCIRAAEILNQQYHVQQGIHMVLRKMIPIGAGLGGGSSDAATALRGLVNCWNLSISEQELHSLALQLGSDVPYFLRNDSAYATGRGEILEYFHLDLPYWIVVVYPNINISTLWAYQNITIQSRQSSITLKDLLLENINNPKQLRALLQNDFEQLILQKHEPVARVKRVLYDSGADFVQLSGSGSSVYGLFLDESQARNTMSELRKHHQTFLTPPAFHAQTQ
ncbi:MAG TPA: 4-(cytidine 5'-diphospho)-2-C-methyl-D-erythritol kinase, partial [Bacteroidota bacterium]|nr:4-(cytidine 5'-diphospho)-2-C-methyl-D-erythritol kinase [Bacteroidota bacterium]